MFGEPATNSMHWCVAPLGEALVDTRYGVSERATTDPTGTPMLRMNNISRKDEISLDDVKFVHLGPVKLGKHLLRTGDLLFNRTNSVDLVGKTGLWTTPDGPIVAASYLIRIRVDPERLVPSYLWALMNTSYMKALLRTKARRAVGMANINATELRRIPVMLPPLALQHHFATLSFSIRQQTERRRPSNRHMQLVFRNLLARSFSFSAGPFSPEPTNTAP